MEWKNFKQHHAGKNESGQALIEFVLGLMIVISFFFFYVKMAAVFAIGNYIHYATFMSARAYIASAPSEEAQRQNAETVLQKMVGSRFKAVVTATDCEGACPEGTMGSVKGGRVGPGPYVLESPADSWNNGVSYSYKAKFSLYPWNRDSEAMTVKLTSESWMPREDSETECTERKGKVQGLLGSAGKNIQVEWDNGC
jgi:hypothetical protein